MGEAHYKIEEYKEEKRKIVRLFKMEDEYYPPVLCLRRRLFRFLPGIGTSLTKQTIIYIKSKRHVNTQNQTRPGSTTRHPI